MFVLHYLKVLRFLEIIILESFDLFVISFLQINSIFGYKLNIVFIFLSKSSLLEQLSPHLLQFRSGFIQLLNVELRFILFELVNQSIQLVLVLLHFAFFFFLEPFIAFLPSNVLSIDFLEFLLCILLFNLHLLNNSVFLVK
jgi:hypothetical protein